MKNFQRVFCTFADSRLKLSLQRIEKQAYAMTAYDQIFIYDESKLDNAFVSKFTDQLKLGSRGYGYWSWKPQVILQTLAEMDDGDVLQYTDSGCHLNPNGRERLLEYFEITKCASSGILSFRTKNASEISAGEKLYQNLEYKYNKGDVFDYFGVLENKEITHTPQFEGGIVFMRKDENTIKFVKQWINTFETNFDFINDSPSVIPNFPGFVDHRHDQSIYSVLCKLNSVQHLFSNEYYTDGDWNTLRKFPIWVKWDKDFGRVHRFQTFLKKGAKFLIRKLGLSRILACSL